MPLVLDETERVYWRWTGQSHDYRRHGTTTLFAALEVATGKIIVAHLKRRRRIDARPALSGASFASLNQLQEHIDAYNNANHVKAEPSSGQRKRSVNADLKSRRITQL